jgi:hypothetical protein
MAELDPRLRGKDVAMTSQSPPRPPHLSGESTTLALTPGARPVPDYELVQRLVPGDSSRKPLVDVLLRQKQSQISH